MAFSEVLMHGKKCKCETATDIVWLDQYFDIEL